MIIIAFIIYRKPEIKHINFYFGLTVMSKSLDAFVS